MFGAIKRRSQIPAILLRFALNRLLERRGIPAVFLHIQKTAGTAITDIVLPYYWGSIIRHGEYRGRSVESLMNLQFVSGHFGYEYARPLIRSRYSFTFLRDPVERILSFYYFCRTLNSNQFPVFQTARELDLTDFLRA
ncbi:MAG: sulfotransferase family 2 domain-containing protein, partial [Gammaproteobacteria bacterium]